MGVLSGLTIVFTGKMSRVRSEMESEAARMGAATEDRVTRRTNWLVTGKRVGKKKTEDAKSRGCRVLSEQEYKLDILARERERAEQMAADNPPPPPKPVKHPKWAKKLGSPNSIRF